MRTPRDKGFSRSVNDWITCSCGKRGWTSRNLARAKMRELREIDDRPSPLNVYRCQDGTTGLFHIGHRHPAPNLNDPRLKWIA